MTVVAGSNGVFVMMRVAPGGLKFQPLISSTFNHLRYSAPPVTPLTPGPVLPCMPPRAMPDSRHKILLSESDQPTRWYNVLHDLPTPPPAVLHPGTGEPVGPDDLTPLFPMDLILQEVSGDQYVEIPGEVLDVYALWRPSPLFRAHRLEKALGTPARIYYKYEGVSPAGSHKPNTAVPQAVCNAKAGIERLTTETGAGQWGTAVAFACAQFDL